MPVKAVAELAAGDRRQITKTVKAVWTNAEGTTLTAVYTDDSTEAWDLGGDPSVDVADA